MRAWCSVVALLLVVGATQAVQDRVYAVDAMEIGEDPAPAAAAEAGANADAAPKDGAATEAPPVPEVPGDIQRKHNPLIAAHHPCGLDTPCKAAPYDPYGGNPRHATVAPHYTLTEKHKAVAGAPGGGDGISSPTTNEKLRHAAEDKKNADKLAKAKAVEAAADAAAKAAEGAANGAGANGAGANGAGANGAGANGAGADGAGANGAGANGAGANGAGANGAGANGAGANGAGANGAGANGAGANGAGANGAGGKGAGANGAGGAGANGAAKGGAGGKDGKGKGAAKAGGKGASKSSGCGKPLKKSSGKCGPPKKSGSSSCGSSSGSKSSSGCNCGCGGKKKDCESGRRKCMRTCRRKHRRAKKKEEKKKAKKSACGAQPCIVQVVPPPCPQNSKCDLPNDSDRKSEMKQKVTDFLKRVGFQFREEGLDDEDSEVAGGEPDEDEQEDEDDEGFDDEFIQEALADRLTKKDSTKKTPFSMDQCTRDCEKAKRKCKGGSDSCGSKKC